MYNIKYTIKCLYCPCIKKIYCYLLGKKIVKDQKLYYLILKIILETNQLILIILKHQIKFFFKTFYNKEEVYIEVTLMLKLKSKFLLFHQHRWILKFSIILKVSTYMFAMCCLCSIYKCNQLYSLCRKLSAIWYSLVSLI